MPRWGAWLRINQSGTQSATQVKRTEAINVAIKQHQKAAPKLRKNFQAYRNKKRSISATLEHIEPEFARSVAAAFIQTNDNYRPDAFRASKRKKARLASNLQSVPQLSIKFANRRQPLYFYSVHLEALGFKNVRYTDYFDAAKLKRIKDKLKRLISGEFYLWLECSDTGLAHIHFLAGQQTHKKLRALEGTKCLNAQDVFNAWGVAYYCAKVKLPKTREAMGYFLIVQTLECERGKRLPKLSMYRLGEQSIRVKRQRKKASKLCVTDSIVVSESEQSKGNTGLERVEVVDAGETAVSADRALVRQRFARDFFEVPARVQQPIITADAQSRLEVIADNRCGVAPYAAEYNAASDDVT